MTAGLKFSRLNYSCSHINITTIITFVRSFITQEAYDDMCSTVHGFQFVTKRILKSHPGARVEASIMNSDVIENMFSSQRGRCNGANTNPSILAYIKAINTIIMTTELQRSSKRNASSTASVGGTHPYHILAKKSFRSKV